MADCVQFLSENRLNGCQIFGRFSFFLSELNFGFPHIPTVYNSGHIKLHKAVTNDLNTDN